MIIHFPPQTSALYTAKARILDPARPPAERELLSPSTSSSSCPEGSCGRNGKENPLIWRENQQKSMDFWLSHEKKYHFEMVLTSLSFGNILRIAYICLWKGFARLTWVCLRVSKKWTTYNPYWFPQMDDVPLKNQQRNPDEVLPTFPYFPGPQSTSQHQVAAGFSKSSDFLITCDECHTYDQPQKI